MNNQGNKCMIIDCENTVESMESYHVLCEYHAEKRRADHAAAYGKKVKCKKPLAHSPLDVLTTVCKTCEAEEE